MGSRLEVLERNYDLDLKDLARKIRETGAKSVLLQFPDGIKIYSLDVVDALKKVVKGVEFRIWLGSCFGACDIPKSDADLLVQFGHAPWGAKAY